MANPELQDSPEIHTEMDSDGSTVIVPGPESPTQRRELDHIDLPDDGNRTSLFEESDGKLPRLTPHFSTAGEFDLTPDEFRSDH